MAARRGGITMATFSLGRIRVSDTLLRLLREPELNFVIAHEVAHIWWNHSLVSGGLATMRAMFENEAQRDPDMTLALAAYDFWRVAVRAGGRLPPTAEVAKQQELDADAWAIYLIGGDVNVAHRALLTLTDGDRDAPSHTWEVFKARPPLMTVGERLDALDARFGVHRG
jgi:Zn-dependent protease with chaperone function